MDNNLAYARLYLNNDRAKKAIGRIFGEMDKGTPVTRAFMVTAFEEVGYVNRLAEQRADWLIAANTEITHWSRFRPIEEGGVTRYGWTPEQLRLNAAQAAGQR